MSNNKQIFDMAALSEAAYADLYANGITITSAGSVKTQLKLVSCHTSNVG